MNRRWRRHQTASRTHDRARPLAAQLGQPREAAAKLARQRVVRVIVETLVVQKPLSSGGTIFDFVRRPPNSTIRVRSICRGDSASGKVSRLNLGLVRDRGVLRTSTTSSTLPAFTSSTNSGMLRVECPTV